MQDPLFYPITAGVERLFVNKVKVDKVIFTKIRSARGKLLHGGGPLDDNFVNEIKDYNPKIRKALLFGIGKLLQVSDNTIENIIKKNLKYTLKKLELLLKQN